MALGDSPAGLQGVAGDGMGWGNDETRHWGLGCDNCVGSKPSTVARSSLAWLRILCQGGHSCVGALERPGVSNLTLARLSFLRELPSPHPSC